MSDDDTIYKEINIIPGIGILKFCMGFFNFNDVIRQVKDFL